MVLSPANAHVAGIVSATPVRDFKLGGGASRVSDGGELARRKQRDRWRAELSTLRSRWVTHLVVLLVGLSILFLVAWFLSQDLGLFAALLLPGIPCVPLCLWSASRLWAHMRRRTELERRLDGVAERRRPYRGRRRLFGGWWSAVPYELRCAASLLLAIGSPVLGVWLGLIGWDMGRGGPMGFLLALACIGLPGLAIGLASWPRSGGRRRA